MKDLHRDMCNAFAQVIFLPASFDKRFCHDMLSVARNDPLRELTEKQEALIETMYHRYRKQITNHERICTVCAPPHP